MMPKFNQPEVIELSNGIPVVLQHYDGPVASVYWWIRVGSSSESKPEAGFAHFLEHMLFKDAAAKESGRASTGQLARLIESLGGEINAYTSFDQTVYHVTCAARHWEEVLDAFGTMAKPQKFLRDDFNREREVILEEVRKNEDSPSRQLFQKLFSSTFGSHPYGRPVIGFVPTLKSARLKELERFYQRNYVSDQMGVILVGPLSEGPTGASGDRKKKILKIVEKRFGKRTIPKKKAPGNLLEKSRARSSSAATWSLKSFDVNSPSLAFSFRLPELGHPDLPALDLISSVLTMGELSRLYQRLFHETSLATDVSGGVYALKKAGIFYIHMECSSVERLNELAKEAFEVIEKLKTEGPGPEEVARVIANMESERLYATQTADGMASRLGFLKFIMGELDYDRQYLELLHELTSEQVREVARRYLTGQNLSGVVLVPQAQSHWSLAELEKTTDQFFSPDHPQPLKKRATPGSPESRRIAKQALKQLQKAQALELSRKPYRVQLNSKIELQVYERPASHVFSIHACTLGGLRLEIASPLQTAQSDWGASSMMASTWAKGTSQKNAKQILAITEGRAAQVDGFSGRNSVGLQMTGLGKDWDVLSPLFTDILLDPIFPEDEILHARRTTEETLRSMKDHSSQLCLKMFLETLFEQHPYGRMTYGSLESLPQITQHKLQGFHQLWVRPERLVLSVSGPIRLSSVTQWADALEEQALRRQTPLNHPLPDRLPDEVELKAPRWVEQAVKREQAHLIVGGLGTQMGSEHRWAVRLLQTLLGGQSGRLFIELREKRSLAYSVAPLGSEGIERGYLGTYLACAPHKKKEALEGIQRVYEQLAEQGPTAKEVSRAQEFYLGRRAMDLQSDPALAAHFGLEALYRVQDFYEDQVAEKVRAVTARELKEVCRKYFVEPHLVTSCVG
ncbi:MAG: M16 family metallopeptidase [Bdellovibrionia bacterium]